MNAKKQIIALFFRPIPLEGQLRLTIQYDDGSCFQHYSYHNTLKTSLSLGLITGDPQHGPVL